MKSRNMFLNFLLMIGVLAVSLFWGVGATRAQAEQQFRVSCNREQPQITISGWLAEENLTVFVDDVQVDQFSTNAEGSANYTFQAPGLHSLQLQRASGETILAGQADCSGPPPEIQFINVTPFEVSLPIGTSLSLATETLNAAGEPLAVNLIWIASGGSIDAQGLYQATEEGQFLITVSLIGQNRGYNSLIETTISPPPVRLAIEPGELTLLVGGSFFLQATGYDAQDNSLPVQVLWSSDPAGITPEGFFEAVSPGDYNVTASLEAFDLQASALIHIIVPLEQISIQPEITEMMVGETRQFEVAGSDLAGNPAELLTPPVWSAELGEIDDNGFYQATTAGEETITVTVDPNPPQGRVGGGVDAIPKQPLTTIWRFPVLPPPAQIDVSQPPEQTVPEASQPDEPKAEPPADPGIPSTGLEIPGWLWLCLGAVGIGGAVATVLTLRQHYANRQSIAVQGSDPENAVSGRGKKGRLWRISRRGPGISRSAHRRKKRRALWQSVKISKRGQSVKISRRGQNPKK